MKKIYLKDLSYDDLKELCMNNEKFMDMYQTRAYEDSMFWQEEETINMFGKDYYKWIDMRDNYNSFYLILRDWREFIDNLDKDYLCAEGLELYNYMIKKIDVLDKMDAYCDNYDNLEDHLDRKCRELLKVCENQLHEYENYPDYEETFNYIYDNEWYLNDDYYTDENKKVIYLDVEYTKEYN